MKVKQGTPEWHDQRKGKITGTRFSKAIGEHDFTQGDQREALGREMYRADNGLSQDPFSSFAIYAMKHGTENEKNAQQTLKKLGHTIRNTSFVTHKDYDWLGVSPDGMMLKGRKDSMCGLEIKCPMRGKDGKPNPVLDVRNERRSYWHQMQLAMECMDVDEMLFFQWYSDEEYFEEWVDRDPDWAETYIPQAKNFLDWYKKMSQDEKCIERWSKDKESVGTDFKDVDEDDETLELAKLITELNELSERKSLLEARKKDLTEVLIDKHQGAFSTKSVKCHITQAQGRINYTSLVKDQGIPYETIEKYRGKGTTRTYAKLVENINEE